MALIPTEIREKFKGLETKYFEKDAVLQFFSRLGSSADVLRQLDALLQVGVVGVGVGADGQVCLRDFLEFLYVQHDQLSNSEAPEAPLPCGLFAGTNEYVLVKADGEILKFKLAGECQEITKRPVSSWQKIKKDFWEVSRLETFDEQHGVFRIDAAEVQLREEDVPKLVGHEVHAQPTKPQGFSSALLGTFTDCFVNQGDKARFRLSISKDAGVYVEYDGKSKESGQYNLLDAFRSQLAEVKRPTGILWTLRLGSDGNYQLLPPPLKVITLTTGQSFDLSHCVHSEPAAVLLGPRIGLNGNVLEGEGECIVSFPGKYADCWRLCVERSLHRTSVACVFLGDEHGWGQHAENPEEIGKCYCHALYGERGHQQFGFRSNAEYEANGRRPLWGCLWFKRWRDNVELAVSRRQRLVAYFFEGQVGEGLITWPELCKKETNLWDGKGLGASQKAELAFLQKMGYDFEQRDVRSTFLARSE